MPTFGEFETVGQPLVSSDERGEVTTIWRAHKTGSREERLYAIKCVTPRPEEPRPPGRKEELDHDPRLKFIKEVVEPHKRAQSKGGRCLAPVYQFGTTETEAWYVTDFYGLSNTLSNSLKQYINGKGEATHAVLRHVIESVVTACLALRQWRGYSHGNLKASNIFRGGRAEWRKAPIFLTDPYPAPPVQFDRYEAGDRSEVSETLRDTIEAQDLAALGAIIRQLVERRLFTSNDEYNYPVETSADWEALGKDAAYWLGWCNKLLNPQLSLQEVNLERLAQDFQPSAAAKKMPLVLAGAGAVCVVAVVGYLAVSFLSSRGEKAFQSNFTAATNEFAAGNLVVARQKIEAALRRKPEHAKAGAWKTKIFDQLTQQSAAALKEANLSLGAAQGALVINDYARSQAELQNASNRWAVARSLAVEEGEVGGFKNTLDEHYKKLAAALAARGERVQRYSVALTNMINSLARTRTALDGKDYQKAQSELLNASNRWTEARIQQVNDTEVAGYKPALDDQYRALETALGNRTALLRDYALAATNMNAALTRAKAATNNYTQMQAELVNASNKWFSARSLGVNEMELAGFKTRLDEQFRTLALALADRNTRARRYEMAVTNVNLALANVKTASGSKDYRKAQDELLNASNNWFEAKSTGVNDPAVAELKTALDEQYRKLGTVLTELSARMQQYGNAVSNMNMSLESAKAAATTNGYSTAQRELASASNSWFTASRLGVNETEVTERKAELDEQYRQFGIAWAGLNSRQDLYRNSVTSLNAALALVKATSATNNYSEAKRQLLIASNHWFSAKDTRVDETGASKLKSTLDDQYRALAKDLAELSNRQTQYDTAVTKLNAALSQVKAALMTNGYSAARDELFKASNHWSTAKGTGLNQAEVDRLKTTLDQQSSQLGTLIADLDKRIRNYGQAITNMNAALGVFRAAAATNNLSTAQSELLNASNFWAEAKRAGGNESDLNGYKSALDREFKAFAGTIAERSATYNTAVTNTTAALTSARIAAGMNNYAAAEDELRKASNSWLAASAVGINEAQTAELKRTLDQQWEAVTKARGNALACARALESVTNALRQAQGALSTSNAALARSSLEKAGTNLTAAVELGAKASLTQELQGALAGLSEEADFQDAQSLFAKNDYRAALALCDKHTGRSRFASLATSIRDEQNTFEDASRRFDGGDYSFLDDLQSKNCKNKIAFTNLIHQGSSQRTLLQQLAQCTNPPADWPKLNTSITSMGSGGFPNKPPFQAILQWWRDNNPKAAIELELRTFQLLFANKPPADYKFPPGEPQALLDKLKKRNVLPSNYVISQTSKINELKRGIDPGYYQEYVAKLQKQWESEIGQLTPEVRRQFGNLIGTISRFND